MRGRNVVRALRLLPLFVALAVAHTWPLAAGLGSLSRHDSADALLNEWILAWDAHALSAAPLRLFEANIFHPAPHALAFSEHLLGQSIVAAPLLWLGAPTLVAHNVALIAGLALTGWTMALVVTRWTGDRWAGVVAGCLLAFNAHTLTRLAHVQAMHVEFLPLALAALDRLLALRSTPGVRALGARLRAAAALAAWSVLQALCSGYLLVMTALALTVGALVRPRDWLGRERERLATAGTLALAAIASALLLAPTLWPYVAVRQEQGLVRGLDEVALYSATPSSWLSTGGRLHYALWSEGLFSADSLFPGVAGLALTLVALAGIGVRRDPRVRMLAAIGLVGAALSFGPRLPGYGWLYHALPLLQGVRGAARFGLLALLAVSGLAGFGLAWLRRDGSGRSPRRRLALAVAVVLAVTLEAWRAPIYWTPALVVSPVYDALARDAGGAVVELPFPGPERTDANARYVLASTRHFRPLVNGYSGFVPASYAAHAAALAHFPDDASRHLLIALGVTHVIVHGAPSDEVQVRADQTPWLARRARFPDATLYTVR